MTYSREEQETTLVFDNSTGQWNVYSTVPKHIRKLSNTNLRRRGWKTNSCKRCSSRKTSNNEKFTGYDRRAKTESG